MCFCIIFTICSVAIEVSRVIPNFYGAQVVSAQTFLMWSVLGGDTRCNQVTSLCEENQPTFMFRLKKTKLFFF